MAAGATVGRSSNRFRRGAGPSRSLAVLALALFASCPPRVESSRAAVDAGGHGKKTYECKSQHGCTVTVGGGKVTVGKGGFLPAPCGAGVVVSGCGCGYYVPASCACGETYVPLNSCGPSACAPELWASGRGLWLEPDLRVQPRLWLQPSLRISHPACGTYPSCGSTPPPACSATTPPPACSASTPPPACSASSTPPACSASSSPPACSSSLQQLAVLRFEHARLWLQQRAVVRVERAVVRVERAVVRVERAVVRLQLSFLRSQQRAFLRLELPLVRLESPFLLERLTEVPAIHFRRATWSLGE